jgi:hypothetical protein
VVSNHSPNPPDFDGPKARAVVVAKRVEPELGDRLISLHVNMQWFIAIAGVEKESIWSLTQYRRHGAMVSNFDG